MSHEDELKWIRAAQQGDRTAYASLVDRYWPRVQRWLQSFSHDAQMAEDLTQDTFLKAWVGLPRFTAGSNFRAWLFCIARRVLIDSHRCGKSPDAGRLPDTMQSATPGPVGTAVARETLALVQQAIGRLPKDFRETFLLRTQEELSYAEIAQVMDIKEETVRWRVFKARKMLLDELGTILEAD